MHALLPFLRLFKFAKLPLFLGLVLMIFIFSAQDSEERKKKLKIKRMNEIKNGKYITTFNVNTCR